MNTTGIIDLASKHSVAETVDRLEALLKAKGIKVFAHIDQTAEARAAGLTMRPTVLVIFGDPKAGTPLMNRYPSLAMDLPLSSPLKNYGYCCFAQNGPPTRRDEGEYPLWIFD
jgi:uncharacterized protein (DUF302 family)